MSSFLEAMAGTKVGKDLSAPGTHHAISSQQVEKDRAVTAARVILRAPNIDKDSDIAVIARQLLRALGLAA